MHIFQSWADIVIMLVIAITYIATFIAQRGQIKALKGTLEALKTTNEESERLTRSQSEHIKTYKELFNLSDIEQHINIQVSVRLNQNIDNVIEAVTKDFLKDNNILENAVKLITDDVKKMNCSCIVFMIYIVKKNKMSAERTRDMVNTFFPNHRDCKMNCVKG